MAQKLIHKRSNTLGKIPTGTTLDIGEIAVNYNTQAPFLSIRNSDDTYSTFSSDVVIANEMAEQLKGKSDTGHTHDDRYYTETEIDTKLEGKSDTGHTHTKSEITDFAHEHKKSEITDFAHEHGSVTLTGDVEGTANFTNTGTSISVTVKDDSHTHDSRYYTEDEIDTKLKGINDIIAERYGFSNIKVGTTTLSADSVTDVVEFKADGNIVLSANTDDDSVTIGVNSNAFAPSSHEHDYSDIKNGPTALKNPNILTVQKNGVEVAVYDGSEEKIANITVPTQISDLTNNLQSLTFGDKTYNGSSAQTITASDLGLGSALKYCGVTTTELSDGATTNPIEINNISHTATAGCVVFYGNEEFVFNGTNWELLGRDANYKVVQTAVADPSANGNATAFIDTISQDANGVISVTKKNVQFPTALKNPNELTIQKNGTKIDSYDGSATKTINITVPTTHSDVGAAAEDHTHNYAGSSSAGGAATSANKLNTNAGSETQPVYFSNGVPVNCTYTLGATVPSNAEFTDTKVASSVSTSKAYLLGSTSSTNTTGTTVKNTSVYMSAGKLYVDGSEVASQTTINNTVSGLTTACNSLNTRVSYLEENSNSTGTVTSVKVTGGTGLSGGGTVTSSGTITLNHAAAYTGTSLNTSGANYYITGLTMDGLGHVTGISEAYDDNNNYYITGVTGSGNGTVTFKRAGLTTDVTWDASHSHSGYVSTSGGSVVSGTTNFNKIQISGTGASYGTGATLFFGDVESEVYVRNTADKDLTIYASGTLNLNGGSVLINGYTPSRITGATGTVSNTTGTPSVSIATGGTASAQTLTFTFTNIKGAKGDKGDTGNPGTNGTDGADGRSVGSLVCVGGSTSTATTTPSTANDGTSYYRIKDTAGNWLSGYIAVKNGSNGTNGTDGSDGKSVTQVVCTSSLTSTATTTVNTTDGATNYYRFKDSSGSFITGGITVKNGSSGSTTTTTTTDEKVASNPTIDKYYLLGTTESTRTTGTTVKNTNVYASGSSTNTTFYAPKISATTITASTAFYQSDERLKDFCGEIDVDFEKLKEIPKKYYTWKSDENKELQIGTSAQKVLEVYPELVGGSEDTNYAVDYARLSIVALKAIDKLHDENQTLRDLVEKMDKRITEMEEKLK